MRTCPKKIESVGLIFTDLFPTLGADLGSELTKKIEPVGLLFTDLFPTLGAELGCRVDQKKLNWSGYYLQTYFQLYELIWVPSWPKKNWIGWVIIYRVIPNSRCRIGVPSWPKKIESVGLLFTDLFPTLGADLGSELTKKNWIGRIIMYNLIPNSRSRIGVPSWLKEFESVGLLLTYLFPTVGADLGSELTKKIWIGRVII